MAESPAELAISEQPKLLPEDIPSSTLNGLSSEELVAKSIAPIKKEFLRPAPLRPSSTADAQYDDDAAEAQTKASRPNFVEKKSKRQLKRERLQEKKSAAHLCSSVAKFGAVSACPFKDQCRYSHDMESYKDQKPADLEGDCPFSSAQGSCPYGLGCRYSGTHKEIVPDGSSTVPKQWSEINGLSKDVQKLLWKNKMQFPKADAKLKALGLLGKGNSKIKMPETDEGDQPVEDNVDAAAEKANVDEMENKSLDKSSAVADDVDLTSASNELRPVKKFKSTIEENCCPDVNVPQKNNIEGCKQIEPEGTNGNLFTESDRSLKVHPREKKLIDFRDKLYLAPLTTVGNLPFRRVCKGLGADITCGEMAMCTNLLQGQASEWALLRRHESEDLFGVQICGGHPDTVTRVVELIDQECTVDFIDINMGCPIDMVVNKGAGSSLLNKPMRMKSIIDGTSSIVDKPITVKVRMGYYEGKNRIDSLIADIGSWGASSITIHGRTRQQRYSKLADWEYIYQCAKKAPETLQVIGNGDIDSYLDWNKHKSDCPELASCMIARGALVKPWIFTEIKEQRHWDISSGERFDILKDYVRFGLQHWGSDTKGVETTRHFLLEWLNYTHRYIPIGVLDVVPARLNWRPPSYVGRDDLETLMASESAADWIRISEMLLGKVPDGFTFAPKHKSNSYDKAENG